MMTNTKPTWLAIVLVGLCLAACSGPATQTAAPATATSAPITIRVAYSSDKGLSDIPSVMAQERLSQQGYIFQPTFYASTELAAAALAQGQADLSYGSPLTYWQLVSKGQAVTLVGEKVASTFLVAGVNQIKDCAGLAGQRLGINSTSALNTVLIKKYIADQCPGTEPQMVIVSGSDTRAASLLAGQLDAALLEASDWAQLDLKAPGQFHIIFNFAHDLPNIIAVGLFASQSFATQHPEALKAYLKANIEVNRDGAQDHSLVVNEAAHQLDTDAATLKPAVDQYFAIKAWDVNGGLTAEKVKGTFDYLSTLDGFDKSLTLDKLADLSYLNAVLDEVGRK